MPPNCPANCQYCKTHGTDHPVHYYSAPKLKPTMTEYHQPEKKLEANENLASGECHIGRGHHYPHHHHHHHTHGEQNQGQPTTPGVFHTPALGDMRNLPLRGRTPPLVSRHHSTYPQKSHHGRTHHKNRSRSRSHSRRRHGHGHGHRHHSHHAQHTGHHGHQEKHQEFHVHHERGKHEYIDDHIHSKKGAESAIIHLAQKHGLDLDGVRAKALEKDLEHIATSLSYSMMAQRVHLDPHAMVGDAPTFQVHRSRIRGIDFRDIIKDFETLGNQYGPPADHLTEAGRSRYMSAAFNTIVSWFHLMIYNRPENFVEAENPRRHGLRNYFKCFGGCTILVLDIRLNLGIGKDRLNYIAQLIAELETCNLNNEKQGFSVPILGILCDGSSFEFFSYDGYSKTFSRGLLVSKSIPGSTAIARVTLPPITQATGIEYIRALRPLCESFYFLLLKGFLAGLEAYIRRARDYGSDGSRNYGSEGQWELALAKAVFARNKSVEAGETAMDGHIQKAERLADEAKALLEESLSSIPSGYQRRVSLMSSLEVADIITA